MVKDRHDITPAEFELLEILWRASSPLSVSQVRRRLQSKRESAYTTVMTLLDKLVRKGSLKRKKEGKAFQYVAAVTREQVLAYALESFLASYFGGELKRLRSFLREESGESESESVAPLINSSPEAQEEEIVLL